MSSTTPDAVAAGHWKTATFVEGLTAPLVIEGPLHGPTFLAYVRQHLAPSLRPEGLLVMDNLTCAEVVGVREAGEAAGAELAYLPSYSPDLNPTEWLVAKLKGFLRSGGERTVAGV